MNGTLRLGARLSLAWPLAAIALACGDAPTQHEGGDIHVHGVVLDDAGTPVVTVDDGVVSGSLAVVAGEETPDYTFVFTDHDGDPITSGLQDFSVDASVADDGVAIFHSTGAHQGHFEGISAGATTVVVSLIHVVDSDSHYDSPPIDLTVN